MSQMLDTKVPFNEVSIESVLLDADLFVKYASPEKAFQLLKESIDRSPRSIPLREKMRDICVQQKNLNEAARQCLALVTLYINREEFDHAYDRLQEAKLLDPAFLWPRGLMRYAGQEGRTSQLPATGLRRRSDGYDLCRKLRIRRHL